MKNALEELAELIGKLLAERWLRERSEADQGHYERHGTCGERRRHGRAEEGAVRR